MVAGRENIPAASAAYVNQSLEPTRLRSRVVLTDFSNLILHELGTPRARSLVAHL